MIELYLLRARKSTSYGSVFCPHFEDLSCGVRGRETRTKVPGNSGTLREFLRLSYTVTRPVPERRERDPPERAAMPATRARPPPRPISPVPETPISSACRKASLSVEVSSAYLGLRERVSRTPTPPSAIAMSTSSPRRREPLTM